MPRQARLDAPGALQHIIIRGIERQKIFRDNDDRAAFLHRLGRVLTESATRCYAWALMPNHAHFLLQTGRAPLATVMRRVLTGYAVTFNRRHRRHGPLFQNRYKSILCEQEPYLLELVRYIHLNPIRGRQVRDLDELDRYPYSGHSTLMGKRLNAWQAVDAVLGQFARRAATARGKYRAFVTDGVAMGRRPDLVGGGLIRSLGGWTAAQALRQETSLRVKGDERILGESEFVLRVLALAEEELKRSEQIRRRGVNLDGVARQAAAAFGLEPDSLLHPGQIRSVVAARSVFCYWAVRELGHTTTALARRLGLTQAAVSIAVRRGERIAQERSLRILDG
jgi:REP element-mobilizing transposase RayT